MRNTIDFFKSLEAKDKIKFVGERLRQHRAFTSMYGNPPLLKENKVYTLTKPPTIQKLDGTTAITLYLKNPYKMRLSVGIVPSTAITLNEYYAQANIKNCVRLVKKYTINDKIDELWKKSNYYKTYIRPKKTKRSSAHV